MRKFGPFSSRPAIGESEPLLTYEDILQQYADADTRGVLVIGERRRVLAVNQVARDLLNYTGGLPAEASTVAGDVNFGFAVGDVFHDRKVVDYEAYIPYPARLLRFHLIPILSRSAEPVLVVVTLEDVARLRHLETVRRDFVANVSHELRTPIASISLLVETLQNGALHDPAAAMHFLQRIQVETQSMAGLVQELLELSRLESGTLSLNLEPIEVQAAFQGVANRLAPVATEKEVEVQLDVQDSLPAVRADAQGLEQILMNLVHNGIKFTPAGGQVTLRARRQGRAVQVEVIDTGVGMDEAEAARVFERFYKVDKGRKRAGGMGLGLAIARHLVELHGGRLQAVSEPGRGSRFFFALPIVD